MSLTKGVLQELAALKQYQESKFERFGINYWSWVIDGERFNWLFHTGWKVESVTVTGSLANLDMIQVSLVTRQPLKVARLNFEMSLYVLMRGLPEVDLLALGCADMIGTFYRDGARIALEEFKA